jgi:hypothetical protein
VELPSPPSEVTATVTKPKHRAPGWRGFFNEVLYLMGRISLVVLLLLVAIVFIVAGAVATGYLFIYFVEHFSGSGG